MVFFPKKYQALGKSATGQAKDKQVPSVFEKQLFGRVLSWDRQGQLKAFLFNMGLLEHMFSLFCCGLPSQSFGNLAVACPQN